MKQLLRKNGQRIWSDNSQKTPKAKTYDSMLTFPSIRNANRTTRSTRECLSEWLTIKHLRIPRAVKGVEKQELLRI